MEVWLPKKSPVWSDDGLEGERGEDASSVEYCEHNVDNLAFGVVGQNWSSEVIPFFLEDWEVGRLASSCHLSMDLLCQENEGCVQGELRVSGFSSFLVFGVPKMLSGGIVTAAKPFSQRGRSVTTRYEGERERRALLSCAGQFPLKIWSWTWCACRGCPFFPSCHLVVLGSFEKIQCVDLWMVLWNWFNVPSQTWTHQYW